MPTLPHRFLLVAVVAALVGMGAGVAMGISQDFTLAPVHAHLNLLGWVSMSLYGLFYHVVPSARRGRLPHVHFALATLGLAIMLPSLTMILLGNHLGEVLIGPGEVLLVASMTIFGLIVLRARSGANVRQPAQADSY